jgi:hypothetical protein
MSSQCAPVEDQAGLSALSSFALGSKGNAAASGLNSAWPGWNRVVPANPNRPLEGDAFSSAGGPFSLTIFTSVTPHSNRFVVSLGDQISFLCKIYSAFRSQVHHFLHACRLPDSIAWYVPDQDVAGNRRRKPVPRILLPGSGGGRWNLILLPGSAQPRSFG